ncbi:MAG TPA: cold shock domain-containing protein [Thermodesulfobacteriota bacterium]|nr:cold shock domain-containing protein [Thermodesulfobacteriota bacterium]
MKGKIKEVIKEKGYGVIEPEEGGEISFRIPNIREVEFNSLKEGDRVEFDVQREFHRYRLKAVNVRTALG